MTIHVAMNNPKNSPNPPQIKPVKASNAAVETSFETTNSEILAWKKLVSTSISGPLRPISRQEEEKSRQCMLFDIENMDFLMWHLRTYPVF